MSDQLPENKKCSVCGMYISPYNWDQFFYKGKYFCDTSCAKHDSDYVTDTYPAWTQLDKE